MDSKLREKVVDFDYAYVMIKSEDSNTSQVVLSKTKLDPLEVMKLMAENNVDIGCDLYFTNRGIDKWTPVSFYTSPKLEGFI